MFVVIDINGQSMRFYIVVGYTAETINGTVEVKGRPSVPWASRLKICLTQVQGLSSELSLTHRSFSKTELWSKPSSNLNKAAAGLTVHG